MENLYEITQEQPEIEMPPPEPYHVYVQTDEQGRIIAVNSSAFVPAEWGTEIDQGWGDKRTATRFTPYICTSTK